MTSQDRLKLDDEATELARMIEINETNSDRGTWTSRAAKSRNTWLLKRLAKLDRLLDSTE